MLQSPSEIFVPDFIKIGLGSKNIKRKQERGKFFFEKQCSYKNLH